MLKRVLVTALSFRKSLKAIAYLKEKGYEVIISPYDRPLQEQELIRLMQDISAVVVGNDAVTEKVIAAGVPTLKLIARSGVGYNTIDVGAAYRYKIPVTNTPGANGQSVADLTMGFILSLARNISQLDRMLHLGGWGGFTGTELGGKTLGIIGTGYVGREVIKRAAGFNMKSIAFDPHPCRELIEKFGTIYLSLDKVIATSDFLSLHAPAMRDTFHMINQRTLQSMKKTAYLINTARGDLVVEEDLCYALEKSIIAGAALDTFAQEPLQNNKLCSLRNVIITPHIGASTKDAADRVGMMAANEVVRVLSGLAPEHLVQSYKCE